ncbi:PLP-dependent aminotransferase family protein [Cohnella lubricantis]|uniref:PLP-dependent aminotransferase family protein n=1 Tax=Cohnella lubricantis TaxID=2163172 RepID=A0A841TDI4_9BACL|nr:PLP-dependent aminotransferase family protein [Cohnella lubricantis]MBB6679092.1 PLP-dependent aminotransferase family protein [Cohnella lubricantis]MBP2119666.1 GntR family transcriptional regulator/MocR family aminotransferase [Cohnella lubricantis]
MFDILLPSESGQPLYRQIYLRIREQIRQGGIPDGTRLPSIRALQSQLNISKTPIETAYQMLTAEGYVVSKPRSGLIVANPHKPSSTSEAEADRQPSGRPQPGASSPPKREAVRRPANGHRIDFDPAALDPDAFPVRIWSQMLKQALDDHAGAIGQYGDPRGEPELRLAVADYLRHSRGVNCSPEQIVIGSGMAYSISILAKLLQDVRCVAFEEPGYSLVRDQFQLSGKEIIPIPVGGQGLQLAALEASEAELVYVTPSHQFPTGSIMPYPERERLLKWAAARNAYIIEDDYDGEFRYQGKPIPSLQSLDAHGRVIYIGTFSKALTPAIRINYMVLPPKLIEHLTAMPHELVFAPSRVEQWAMYAFIAQGHWYRHIRRTRSLYRLKHQHLIALIHEYLGGQVEITGQNAGLHIQLSVKLLQTSEQLVERAAGEGVQVYDWRRMWLDRRQRDAGDPRLYMGFAGLSLQAMETGIRLLQKAWLK